MNHNLKLKSALLSTLCALVPAQQAFAQNEEESEEVAEESTFFQQWSATGKMQGGNLAFDKIEVKKAFTLAGVDLIFNGSVNPFTLQKELAKDTKWRAREGAKQQAIYEVKTLGEQLTGSFKVEDVFGMADVVLAKKEKGDFHLDVAVKTSYATVGIDASSDMMLAVFDSTTTTTTTTTTTNPVNKSIFGTQRNSWKSIAPNAMRVVLEQDKDSGAYLTLSFNSSDAIIYGSHTILEIFATNIDKVNLKNIELGYKNITQEAPGTIHLGGVKGFYKIPVHAPVTQQGYDERGQPKEVGSLKDHFGLTFTLQSEFLPELLKDQALTIGLVSKYDSGRSKYREGFESRVYNSTGPDLSTPSAVYEGTTYNTATSDLRSLGDTMALRIQGSVENVLVEGLTLTPELDIYLVHEDGYGQGGGTTASFGIFALTVEAKYKRDGTTIEEVEEEEALEAEEK